MPRGYGKTARQIAISINPSYESSIEHSEHTATQGFLWLSLLVSKKVLCVLVLTFQRINLHLKLENMKTSTSIKFCVEST